MTRSAALLVLSVFPFVGSCGLFSPNTCNSFCDYFSDCQLDLQDDAGYECDFEEDEKAFAKECVAACKEEYAKLSSNDREEVDTCITCLIDEVNGDCDLDDYVDAVGDCEDECDDSDVVDFFDDFFQELDLGDHLECEDGSGTDGTGTTEPPGTTTTYY